MANKRLRIMILESDHLQRLSIEKMLNGLGYHAVIGMGATEALAALRYATQTFDLIIANAALVGETGIDFADYCKDHPFVLNTLVYDCPMPVFEPKCKRMPLKTQAKLSRPPDSLSIRYLMDAIDCRDAV